MGVSGLADDSTRQERTPHDATDACADQKSGIKTWSVKFAHTNTLSNDYVAGIGHHVCHDLTAVSDGLGSEPLEERSTVDSLSLCIREALTVFKGDEFREIRLVGHAEVVEFVELVRALFGRCACPFLISCMSVLNGFASLGDTKLWAFANDLLRVGGVCNTNKHNLSWRIHRMEMGNTL